MNGYLFKIACRDVGTNVFTVGKKYATQRERESAGVGGEEWKIS